MGRARPVYKVIFQNQGQVVELFAQSVGSSELLGFVEVRDLKFRGRSEVVVDPGAEGLEAEFGRAKRLLLPFSSILRIEEVDTVGSARVRAATEVGGLVKPFPVPLIPPPKPPKNP
jgi:hypothetical protein